MSLLERDIEKIQEKLGYSFNNLDLLYQAFTRKSYSIQYGSEHNEVLEFIGDSVLNYHITKIIDDEFGFLKENSDYYDEDNDNNEYCIVANLDESDFTELRKKIISNKTLAKAIDRLGFAKYLFLGDVDINNNVSKNKKVKADLFEAIIGAITIDSEWDSDSIEESISCMLNIDKFLDEVDTEEIRPDKFKLENAITTLKELAEQGACSMPEYYFEDEEVEEDGEYWWACTCHVDSWRIEKKGLSKSKKGAKRYAAYLVLCDYYNIPNEYEDYDV